MICISENSIIDRILSDFKPQLGNDFTQYRNHVYRVFNFALPWVETEQEKTILAIAVAFHDLGIWTAKTFDYLEPSIKLAKKYCEEHPSHAADFREISTIIDQHHKLTRIRNSPLVEVFRQADLVDLTLGLIPCGRKKGDISLLKKLFPNEGFHLNLLWLFLRNFIRHPLNPLPMYKL